MRAFVVAKSRDGKDENGGRRRGGRRVKVKIWVVSKFEDGGARFWVSVLAHWSGPVEGVSGESWGRRAARLVAESWSGQSGYARQTRPFDTLTPWQSEKRNLEHPRYLSDGMSIGCLVFEMCRRTH